MTQQLKEMSKGSGRSDGSKSLVWYYLNELLGIFQVLVLGVIAGISSPAFKVASRNMLDSSNSNNSNNDRCFLYFPKDQVLLHIFFSDRNVFLLRLNYYKSFCHSYDK